jgi:hypothetical protein
MYEAPRSRRIWGWRARVLEVRTRLQRLAEAEAKAREREAVERTVEPDRES